MPVCNECRTIIRQTGTIPCVVQEAPRVCKDICRAARALDNNEGGAVEDGVVCRANRPGPALHDDAAYGASGERLPGPPSTYPHPRSLTHTDMTDSLAWTNHTMGIFCSREMVSESIFSKRARKAISEPKSFSLPESTSRKLPWDWQAQTCNRAQGERQCTLRHEKTKIDEHDSWTDTRARPTVSRPELRPVLAGGRWANGMLSSRPWVTLLPRGLRSQAYRGRARHGQVVVVVQRQVLR